MGLEQTSERRAAGEGVREERGSWIMGSLGELTNTLILIQCSEGAIGDF